MSEGDKTRYRHKQPLLLPTCYSRGVWVPMRILHVLHQLLAIHEQFLTLRTIDSVGATDQGSVLWGRDTTEVKFSLSLPRTSLSPPSLFTLSYTPSLTSLHLFPLLLSFSNSKKSKLFLFPPFIPFSSSEFPIPQSFQLMYIYTEIFNSIFHLFLSLSLLVIPHTAPLSCLVTARLKPHLSPHTTQRHTSRTKMPHNTHLPHHSTPS